MWVTFLMRKKWRGRVNITLKNHVILSHLRVATVIIRSVILFIIQVIIVVTSQLIVIL